MPRQLQRDPGWGFFTIQPQAPQCPQVICQAGVVLAPKHEHPGVHSTHAVTVPGLGLDAMHLQLTPGRPAQPLVKLICMVWNTGVCQGMAASGSGNGPC